MMKLLVYCSYPVLDQSQEPSWVDTLAETINKHGMSDNFVLYRPWHPLGSQKQVFPLLREPHPFFKQNEKTLGIPLELGLSFENPQLQRFLSSCDDPEPRNTVIYRDMYCLIRSHIVLADLSKPSFGEVFQDVLFASMAGIPIVGLSDRFLQSPHMMNRVDVFTSPLKTESLVRQLVSYSLGYGTPEEKSKEEDPKPEEELNVGATGQLQRVDV